MDPKKAHNSQSSAARNQRFFVESPVEASNAVAGSLQSLDEGSSAKNKPFFPWKKIKAELASNMGRDDICDMYRELNGRKRLEGERILEDLKERTSGSRRDFFYQVCAELEKEMGDEFTADLLLTFFEKKSLQFCVDVIKDCLKQDELQEHLVNTKYGQQSSRTISEVHQFTEKKQSFGKDSALPDCPNSPVQSDEESTTKSTKPPKGDEEFSKKEQDYSILNVKKVTAGTHFVNERIDPGREIQTDAPAPEPQKLPNEIHIDELTGGNLFVNRWYVGKQGKD